MPITTWPTAGQEAKNVRFPHITPRSVVVTWSAPDRPQGEIKAYQVEATNSETGSKEIMVALRNETTFSDLEPNTTYNISIMVENMPLSGHGGGVGPAVTAAVTTLPLGKRCKHNLLHFTGYC
ncbi:hypothetical protein AAHC03_025564 [Spirometra sp. Aus1]